jgi:hypothetical protein
MFCERRLSLLLPLSLFVLDLLIRGLLTSLCCWLADWLLEPEALAVAAAAAPAVVADSGTCKYQFETQGLMFGGIMAFYIFFPI